MTRALEALARLREGNRRFASDEPAKLGAGTGSSRRNELRDGQRPFAIVLGCSDSRVPAELVFDQGLGDLFTIRVAGNIVASSQVDSVEFAAAKLGTSLAVVLGHSQCGAVQATLSELSLPAEERTGSLRAIVDRVRPAVEGLVQEDVSESELLERAVRANIRKSAHLLREGSEALRELIRTDQLVVVGAEYSLTTGLVDFFDGVPEGAFPAAEGAPGS